jgi:histidine triad (HIT) family protein
MQDSVFTKIIRGELPCHKVYEDAKTFVFMSNRPIQPGQVVVVPRKQVEFVWDLDDADYQALMAAGKKIAAKIRQVFPDKTHVALHIEGLEVAHAHLKLFPFSTAEEVSHHPDPDPVADATLAEIAAKLRLPDEL